MSDRLDVFHHLVSVDVLAAIHERLGKIMATQAELVTKLNAMTEQVKKIGAETAKSLELIKTLQDAQAAAGNTTPAVDAATDALAAQLGVVDNLVPDVAPGNVPQVV